jgi:hypothetical protein
VCPALSSAYRSKLSMVSCKAFLHIWMRRSECLSECVELPLLKTTFMSPPGKPLARAPIVRAVGGQTTSVIIAVLGFLLAAEENQSQPHTLAEPLDCTRGDDFSCLIVEDLVQRDRSGAC